MNGSDVPSNYWLLFIIFMCYLLNYIAYSKDSKIPDHRFTTDGVESQSSTGTSEGSQPKILSTRVPNGFLRSRSDQEPSAVKPTPIKPMPEFDPKEKILAITMREYWEQITKKGNKVLTTNFTLEIQNRKIEELITYSIDQQEFKFKAIIEHEDCLETINLDELNNLELWGASVD